MSHAKLGVIGGRSTMAHGPVMQEAGGRSWTTVDWKRHVFSQLSVLSRHCGGLRPSAFSETLEEGFFAVSGLIFQ